MALKLLKTSKWTADKRDKNNFHFAVGAYLVTSSEIATSSEESSVSKAVYFFSVMSQRISWWGTVNTAKMVIHFPAN